MNWIKKEKWLAVLLIGYVAWVVPYDIRQYTSFVSLVNPGLHTFITLAAITLICATLTVILILAGKESALAIGVTVAIPWMLLSLACDFGLDTYYRGWKPDFLAYGLWRVMQFVFVPIGCIVGGVLTLVFLKPKVNELTPVTVIHKVRK